MNWRPIVLAMVLATACSTSSHSKPRASGGVTGTSSGSPSAAAGPGTMASPSPVEGARRVAGGCGSTPLFRGATPPWAPTDPTDLTYAVATPATAAGFLFGYPLRAGHPQQRANKILWVVRSPREDKPLVIDGHPLGLSSPTVHVSRAADSGPGEIYPSIIDVPGGGCWHFTLVWATGRAELDLAYRAK
jgi:hypothetical protein